MSQYSESFPQVVSVDQGFMRRVYNWMAAGLGLSALVAFYLMNNEAMIMSILSNQMLFWGLIIGEFVLVIWLSARIAHMGSTQAMIMYFLYAGINGITLTPILLYYTRSSIVSTFLIAGGMFAATSVWGYATKMNLSSWGGYLMMALIGAIIASVVGMFFGGPGFNWFISLAIVAIGVGLTAYQTQRIKEMSSGQYGDEEMETKSALMGAFSLYLTFVMMFVHLLRLFGNRR